MGFREIRFIGNAVIDGKRKRVSCNIEVAGDPGSRAGYEHIFNKWCAERGYFEPDLVDWFLA